MVKEIILFVPGLSARAPAKYNEKLQKNLENYAKSIGQGFRLDTENTTAEGAAGAAVVYEHDPDPKPQGAPETPRTPETEKRLIVFREVVWGDIPRRLSELSALQKFLQGFALLKWAFWSLFTKFRAIRANKYQWACLLGALVVLFAWYLGVIVVLPTIIDYAFVPEAWRDTAKEALGAVSGFISTFSVGGTSLWATTSIIMGILPVTALVDSAFAMKQYLRDAPVGDNAGLVGEEARARISNALGAVRNEQYAAGGPTYGRITILTHSFGVAPALEALAMFGVDLRAPVRIITLGAPLSFVGALHEGLEAQVRDLADNGQSARGARIDCWRCVWSTGDYISSDPEWLTGAKPAWPGFRDEMVRGQGGYWLFNCHGAYFDFDRVAEIILDRGDTPLPAGNAAAPAATGPAPAPATV